MLTLAANSIHQIKNIPVKWEQWQYLPAMIVENISCNSQPLPHSICADVQHEHAYASLCLDHREAAKSFSIKIEYKGRNIWAVLTDWVSLNIISDPNICICKSVSCYTCTYKYFIIFSR